METIALTRLALTISAAAALLTACGGSQPPIGVPSAMQQAAGLAKQTTSSNYKVLYNFRGAPDGDGPGSLLDVGGTLYGTTAYGGAYHATCYDYFNGCGTVFSITTGGMEKVLHSFHGPDGEGPESLLDLGGTLYGTTGTGGTFYDCGYSVAEGCGTVFSITTGGTEKVLYDFGAQYTNDGRYPNASLIEVKGTLYGTTSAGGKYHCGTYNYNGCGTTFRVTTSGREKVLHSFGGGSGDGHHPVAGLTHANGTLYGTTGGGGVHKGGTLFSMTRDGRVKVLHSFGAAKDGAGPDARLLDVKGTLYGTTVAGGAYGDGTVFSVTADGTEKVLYSFAGGNDGKSPGGGLINVKGTLYGTTIAGGGYYCATNNYNGCGTVFSITRGGTETVLHSFGAGADGAWPSSLIYVSGTLYGTTLYGGANSCFGPRCGIVFALTL